MDIFNHIKSKECILETLWMSALRLYLFLSGILMFNEGKARKCGLEMFLFFVCLFVCFCIKSHSFLHFFGQHLNKIRLLRENSSWSFIFTWFLGNFDILNSNIFFSAYPNKALTKKWFCYFLKKKKKKIFYWNSIWKMDFLTNLYLLHIYRFKVGTLVFFFQNFLVDTTLNISLYLYVRGCRQLKKSFPCVW